MSPVCVCVCLMFTCPIGVCIRPFCICLYPPISLSCVWYISTVSSVFTFVVLIFAVFVFVIFADVAVAFSAGLDLNFPLQYK
ncbi:hypothetical protein DE146DRAFT_653627 [Phaeosphaeria sp. MPI-PUGE-AT-0046c]|nr:hypothetical protein DE146DRAFT_653627 [Phaeosphaeria sp. MPI-PUGE-AT-0046c]